jgi:hypothetical protein
LTYFVGNLFLEIVGSGDLRQMSEIPSPWRAISFLHPEEMEACISAS